MRVQRYAQIYKKQALERKISKIRRKIFVFRFQIGIKYFVQKGGIAAFLFRQVGVGLDGVAGVCNLFVGFQKVGFMFFEVEHVCQLHFVTAFQSNVSCLEQVFLAVGGQEDFIDGMGAVVVEVVKQQQPACVMVRGGGIAGDEAA